MKASGTDFELLEVMSLPAAYTKGADAMGRSNTHYERQSISFRVDSFSKMVRQIEAMAKAGAEVNPEDFYPPARRHKGKSRDLPMVDMELRGALIQHLSLHIENAAKLKPTSPLFISQKGVPYSPLVCSWKSLIQIRVVSDSNGALGRGAGADRSASARRGPCQDPAAATLASLATRRVWSVKALTERGNDTKAILSGQASRGALPDRDANIERPERLIREKYCLPCEVTFSDSQVKGKVTLTYHSLEELQGLLEAWGIDN